MAPNVFHKIRDGNCVRDLHCHPALEYGGPQDQASCMQPLLSYGKVKIPVVSLNLAKLSCPWEEGGNSRGDTEHCAIKIPKLSSSPGPRNSTCPGQTPIQGQTNISSRLINILIPQVRCFDDTTADAHTLHVPSMLTATSHQGCLTKQKRISIWVVKIWFKEHTPLRIQD